MADDIITVRVRYHGVIVALWPVRKCLAPMLWVDLDDTAVYLEYVQEAL